MDKLLIDAQDRPFVKLALFKACLAVSITLGFLGIFGYLLPINIIFIVFALSLLLAIGLLLCKNIICKEIGIYLAAISVACLVFSFHYKAYIAFDDFDGTSQTIKITALEESIDNQDDINIVGMATLEDGRTCKAMVYLTPGEKQYFPGDILSVKVKLYSPKKPNRKASLGVFLTGYAKTDEIHLGHTNLGIRGLPYSISTMIKRQIDAVFSNNRANALVSALLTGDKGDISQKDLRDFSLSGTSHVMAVSGLHISIIVAFLIAAFGKRIGSPVAIFAMIFYSAISGFSISSLRAVIMSSMSILAFILGREYNKATAFAFALTILLIGNPFLVFNVGFVLSFSSTLGIILFMPRFTDIENILISRLGKLNKPAKFITSSLSVSISTILITTPFLNLYFDRISIISIASNIFVIFPVTLIICLCFLILAISTFYMNGAIFLANLIVVPLIKYVYHINEIFANLSFSSTMSGNIYFLIFWTLFFIGMMGILALKKGRGYICAALVVCGIVCSYLSVEDDKRSVYMTVSMADFEPIVYINDRVQSIALGAGNGKYISAYKAYDNLNFKFGSEKIDELYMGKVNKANSTGVLRLKDEGLEIQNVFGSPYKRELYGLTYDILESYTFKDKAKYDLEFFPLKNGEGLVKIIFGDVSVLWSPMVAPKTMLAELIRCNIYADILIISQEQLFDQELSQYIYGVIMPKTIVVQNRVAINLPDDYAQAEIVQTAVDYEILYKFKAKSDIER